MGQPRGDVQLYEYLEYSLPKLDVLPEQPQPADGLRRLSSSSVPQSECQLVQDTLKFSKAATKFEEALSKYEQRPELNCILDAVNKQARAERRTDVSAAVLHAANGEIRTTEVQSVITRVAEIDVNEATVQTVVLFDATYKVEAKSVEYMFPTRSGQDFLFRATAVKGVSGETQIQVEVEDSLSGVNYPLNALDGQISLAFALSPFSYIEGQTECQGYNADGWISDVCLTVLSESSAECQCSLTSGITAVSFRHDASLPILVPETHEFKQSYNLTAFVTAIVVLSLLSTFYLHKQDKMDKQRVEKLSGWKLDVVKQVAD